MPWINKPFNGYWFRIHAQQTRKSAATVFCTQDGNTVGWLEFEYGRDTTEAFVDQNNTIHMTLPATMLSPVMDILRLEQPLWMLLNTDDNWGHIQSGVEPAGEGET